MEEWCEIKMEFAITEAKNLIHSSTAALVNKNYCCAFCHADVEFSNTELRFMHKDKTECKEAKDHQHWLSIPPLNAKELPHDELIYLKKRITHTSLSLSPLDEKLNKDLVVMELLKEIELQPRQLLTTIRQLRDINPNLSTVNGDFCLELNLIIDALYPLTNITSKDIQPKRILSTELDPRIHHFIFNQCKTVNQLKVAQLFWLNAYCLKVKNHAPSYIYDLVNQHIKQESDKNLMVITLDDNVVQLLSTQHPVETYMQKLHQRFNSNNDKKERKIKLLASAEKAGQMKELLISHIKKPTFKISALSGFYRVEDANDIVNAVKQLAG